MGRPFRFSLYMGRSYGHPADPCQTTRHGLEVVDHAAPCANLLSGPVFGTVPTSAPHMGYDWGAIGRTCAVALPNRNQNP